MTRPMPGPPERDQGEPMSMSMPLPPPTPARGVHMNEKVVTVEIDRPEAGAVTYAQGRSWAGGDFHGVAILHICDKDGAVIAAHRDWASVRLDDAPDGVSAA